MAEDGRGGMAQAVSLARALAAASETPSVFLSAGDTFIPSPELSVAVGGENAVTRSNNFLGLAASALGNHEFDNGEAFLAERIRESRFPFLTCTLFFDKGPLRDLTVDESQLTPTRSWAVLYPGRILPRTTVCAGGRLEPERDGFRCTGTTVGVIGITTESLHLVSSVSANVRVPANFDELRHHVRRQADQFASQGIDIVVAVSHLQTVEKEIRLVEEGLVGVDVIISGGGEEHLANRPSDLHDDHAVWPLCSGERESCYPIVRRARNGHTVLIASADGHLEYLGRLVMDFDDSGAIRDYDREKSRPFPIDHRRLEAAGVAVDPVLARFEDDVTTMLAPLRRALGRTETFLNGERESARSRETNLGNFSADSMIFAARRAARPGVRPVAFALRNGGGIRQSIGRPADGPSRSSGGPVTEFDLRSSLRFDNELVMATTTHRVLKETLEAAFDSADLGGGGFPQVSREVYLEYLPVHTVRPDGETMAVSDHGHHSIRTLRVSPAEGGSPVEIVRDGELANPDARISFVTLSFLAKGGDGYFAHLVVEVDPIEGAKGEKLREQEAFRLYIADRTPDADVYPDPDPSRPETFQRIRPLAPARVPGGSNLSGGFGSNRALRAAPAR